MERFRLRPYRGVGPSAAFQMTRDRLPNSSITQTPTFISILGDIVNALSAASA